VAALGQASFPVNYTIPVQSGQVTATIDGDLTLRQGPAAAGVATLAGTVRYSLFRPTVTTRETPAGARVGFNCRTVFGNCSLDSTLSVPQGTAVSLSSEGGDMSVGTFTGNLSLNTDGGNLTAGTLSSSQTLSISTSGGDASISTLTGPSATLLMNGGNLTVDGLATTNATVRSGGGDVDLTVTRGNADITANGGNVTVVLPRGSQYDVQGYPNGGNFTDTAPNYPSSKNVIVIHSSGGDINVREAS
jgi:hypothetical protein